MSRKEAIGRLCPEVFRSSMCEAECALRRTLKTGKPVIGRSGFIIDADGTRIPISVSTAVLRDAGGRVVGGAETFRDLSEVEALRRELEGKFRIGDLVSRSPVMQKVFEVLPAIAASPSTVLILGETGTGQGTGGADDSLLERAKQGPLRRGQLRRPAGYAPGIGAVRLQGGGVHRGDQGQARAFRAGQGGDPLPRRDRRGEPGPAGPAAAGAAGADLRAAGRDPFRDRRTRGSSSPPTRTWRNRPARAHSGRTSTTA